MFCSEKKKFLKQLRNLKGSENCYSENRDGQSQNTILIRSKCNYKVSNLFETLSMAEILTKRILLPNQLDSAPKAKYFLGEKDKQTKSI